MSELKKLTRLGSDTKKIAALLQAKAPKGHMLAYINPREAALLKQHGGSGKPHADTGILSFEDGMDAEPGFETFQPTGDTVVEAGPPPIDTSGLVGPISYAPEPAPGTASYGFQARPTSAGAGLTPVAGFDVAPSVQVPESPRYALGAGGQTLTTLGGAPEAPEKRGLFDMSDKEKRELMLRAGLGLGQGLLGSRMATRAAAQGRAGAEQMQKVASPYQQMGQQIQAQAQRGELTPAAQQSLQAVRAQAAQAAERRGGVGVQQAQQQIEAFRQQLLQQQFDYGLKLSGIGDQIALGAIKTGMQADQYVNQLTSNYYNNIFRYLGGQPAAQQQQQPVTVGG